jgi:hypothetical protein
VSHVLPVFAPAYEITDPDERRKYVAAELRNLVQSGGAVLLAILQPAVADGARMTALEMLRDNADDDGEQVLDPSHQWRLRLKDGAKPPAIDPNGLRLGPDKAGKVLVAKIGVLGGARGRENDTKASVEWQGPARAIKSMTGQKLLATREVTSKPTVFSLRDATLVLQKWGVGVALKQYAKPRNWKPGEYFDPDDPKTRGQDQWLVEELPVTASPAAESDAKPGKAA